MTYFAEQIISINAEINASSLRSIIPNSRRVAIFADLTSFQEVDKQVFLKVLDKENWRETVSLFSESYIRDFITKWFTLGGFDLTVLSSRSFSDEPVENYNQWVLDGRPIPNDHIIHLDGYHQYLAYEEWLSNNRPVLNNDDKWANVYNNWVKFQEWNDFLTDSFATLTELPNNLVFGTNEINETDQLNIFNIYKPYMVKDLHLSHFVKRNIEFSNISEQYSGNLSVFIQLDDKNRNVWGDYLVQYNKNYILSEPEAYIRSKYNENKNVNLGEIFVSRNNLFAICKKHNVGCLTNIEGTTIDPNRQFFDNIVEFNTGNDKSVYLILGDIKHLVRNNLISLLINNTLRKNEKSVVIVINSIDAAITNSYLLNDSNNQHITNLEIYNKLSIDQQLSKDILEGFVVKFVYTNEINGLSINMIINVSK